MKRSITLTLRAAALVSVVAPVALRAQAGTRPTFDQVTVAGAFGGLSGAANLDPAGTADWRTGFATSVDATYWLQRYVGVRAGGSWAQDSLRGASLSGRGKFNKFAYDADLILRYPTQTGRNALAPYLIAGAGAVSLHQLGSDSTWTKFAGNVGAGVEYRYGFDRTQHDIAWQGGVTVSF